MATEIDRYIESFGKGPKSDTEPSSETNLAPLVGGALAIGAGIMFRRPLVAALKTVTPKGWKEFAGGIPQELPLLRNVPKTPVISTIEEHATNLSKEMQSVVAQPWSKIFHERSNPADWIKAEDAAYSTWQSLGGTNAARTAAYNTLPTDMKGAINYINTNLRPREQAAAQFLRHHGLADEPGPYIPHIAEQDLSRKVSLGSFRSGTQEVTSTLGSFEKPRAYATMSQGIAAGMKYGDPRQAILQRIWAGQKLTHTAELVRSLENRGILFRDPKAAMAAGGKAVQVDGIPGQQTWFASSVEEAKFIRDNLRDTVRGPWGALVHRANQLFRNPNLYNPLPHFTKNMLYKYGWSGGNLGRVFQDMHEIAKNGNPALVARFKQVMPFEDAGKTAQDIFLNLHAQIEGSKMNTLLNVLSSPNKWSSKLIFTKLDPWLRYSRWKQYVEKGMGDQEAANHVWIDLVRYGTRSDLVDFWKSIPTNFFVPWRVGSWTSFIKNVQENPLRTALFIGGMDFLREMVYRQTGWWMHMPIDYIEGPFVRILEAAASGVKTKDVKVPLAGDIGIPYHELPGALGSVAGTTALFGPGGQSTAYLAGNLLKSIGSGTLDQKQLMNLLWGWSALFDPYGMIPETAAFAKDQDPKRLSRIIQMAAFGAHDAVNHMPRRIGQFLPESLLGKSDRVKQAETIQGVRKARAEKRASRPARTIRDIVGE